MAEGILIVAAILISLGVLFGVLRLVLGRSVVDRVAAVDMLTVVLIGSSNTREIVRGTHRFVYTPRGYAAKPAAAEALPGEPDQRACR